VWTIDRAREGDLAPLARLLEAVRPGRWSTDALRAEWLRSDAIILVARGAAGAPGVLIARRVLDELHVHDVAVATELRRRGVGGELLDALAAVAGPPEVRRILLELRAGHAAALGLYAGHGFVVVGRRPRYYPDGEDAILMTRTIESGQSGLPLRVDVPVVENRAEGGANHRLVVRVPGWPGAEPGQFVMLSAGARTDVERTDPLLPRPMAVYRGHAKAAAAEIEILYKASGRGTRLLAETLPGQQLRMLGPLGGAFPPIPRAGAAILVGGGTGIASLYELASRAAGAAVVHVVLGARGESDLMGVEDFASLDVDLHVATEDGSRGQRGVVTDVLGPLLDRIAGPAPTIYACGPTPMMHACARIAKAADTRCVVSLENNMACGFGVCLGCAVPMTAGGYSLLCRAGPVYDAGDVVWERLS
jgi:dihydroorotate dehydrogenase electron transfer subunit